MAINRIPSGLADLLHLASACKSGAASIGPAIPLVLNTSGAIGSDRASLVQLQFAYRNSMSNLPALRQALKNARADGRSFATKARDWLEYSLGTSYSLAWSAVGFDNNSLEIPKDAAGLETLLERMYLYFQSNAAQENPDPKVNVTAARAQTFCLALGSAVGNLNSKKQECGTKKSSRNAAKTTLRKRLRGLVNELAQALADNDPRWREFGLNLPAAPNVPAVPQNVQVNTQTVGEFFITCAPSQYASHYRLFTQRPNLDEEPVLAGSSDEPMFHLTGLTPGTEYEVLVTAVNEGAESLFSDPVTAVVRGEEEAAA